MKKISVFFITIFMLSACGLELTKVEVDLENGFVPEVAISSYLVPDSMVNLKLDMTRAAYSGSNNANVTLKSATIERLSDNQVYTLSQNQRASYVELSSKELKPLAGEVYKLCIETQNPTAILKSVDTIPTSTPILDAEILPVEKSSNQLGRITFKPSINSKGTTFYEIVILICEESSAQPSNKFYQMPFLTTNDQIVTREDYYPSLLLIGAIEPQSLLFRSNDSKEAISISFLYRAGAVQSATNIYTISHKLKIELRTVSYAYFNYKTSLYKQGYAANGDLLYGMAAPVTVKGNIKGGLGIFAGYGKADTTISVAGRTGLNN
jgi:hypothetical protein